MNEQFTPGDLGFDVGEMVGGPFDGARYKDIPVVPGPTMPDAISIPLGGPGAPEGRAHYKRRDQKDEPYWCYDYVGTEPPKQLRALEEAPVGTAVRS